MWFNRRSPEEEAGANLARAAGGLYRELTRESTRADAVRDRMGPRVSAVGAAITAGWAQFTAAIAARFQRPTPRPQPATPALNYAAIAAADAAALAGRPGELGTLLIEVQTYITELEARVAAGPTRKYNGFGSFLQQYLGFSVERLRAWGVFSAEEKLVQAKHLRAAIHFNFDGTVTSEVDPVRQGDPAALDVLERGRLGKFAERLTAPEFGTYELMRQQKGDYLAQLRRLNIDSLISELTNAVETLERQSEAPTMALDVIAAANLIFKDKTKNKTILDTIQQAKRLLDAVCGYCGRDTARFVNAKVKDAHVKEALALYARFQEAVPATLLSLGERANTANNRIEARKRAAASTRATATVGAVVSPVAAAVVPVTATAAGTGITTPPAGTGAGATTHHSILEAGTSLARGILGGARHLFHKRPAVPPTTGATPAAAPTASL